MKIIKIHFIIYFVCLINMSSSLKAQNSTARFLLWPPSAKYSAMGGVGASFCEDAFACHYNPAGIAFSKFTAAESFVQPYRFFENTALYYSATSININRIGAFGLTLYEYWSDRQLITDETGATVGVENSFSPAELFFNPQHWEAKFSYATLIKKNFAVGLNISLLRIRLSGTEVGSERGTGKLFTAMFGGGIMVKNLFPELTYKPKNSINNSFVSKFASNIDRTGFNFGLSLLNAGAKIMYIDAAQKDNLPTLLTTGFSYWPIFSDLYSIMVACEFEKQIHEPSTIDYIHLGNEILLMKILSLRNGFYLDTFEPNTSFYTYGIGINLKNFSLNIARYKKSLLHTWHFDITFSKEL